MDKRNRRIGRLTNEEEARIQRQIASDPDAPELTDEQLRQGKPFAEMFPELMGSIRRARGRPVSENPKVPVTIRLDREVVEKFKATGRGWQGRMNEALKAAKV